MYFLCLVMVCVVLCYLYNVLVLYAVAKGNKNVERVQLRMGGRFVGGILSVTI